MKNIRSIIVLVVLVSTIVILGAKEGVSQGRLTQLWDELSSLLPARVSSSETEFPQLSAEVNYEDVTKRIEWMNDLIQKGTSFHELLNHPGLENVNNVPNYESKVTFFAKKIEGEKYFLGMVGIGKRSPKRSPYVDIVFQENGIVGFYKEFILGHIMAITYNKIGKLNRISLEDFVGEREIKFDDNEHVLTDTYNKFGARENRERLEIKQQKDEEILASIEAGYTAIQMQKPKEWQLKLPEGSDDEAIRDRLEKIEGYRQAIIAGNATPLLDSKVFVRNDVWLTVNVFYSGKKVSFVGVTHGEIGYFMVFDEYFRLVKYAEGEIEFDQNLTGHEVAKSARLFLEDWVGERNRKASGLEITFHPTGYPANYKTITKDEPLGRQIEWDEDGNVISDIDTSPPEVAASKEPVIEPETESTGGNVAAGIIEPTKEIPHDKITISGRALEPDETYTVVYPPPHPDRHPDEMRARTNVTTTIVALPKDKLKVAYEPYVFPEKPPISRLIALSVGSFIALLFLIWYLHKKGI